MLIDQPKYLGVGGHLFAICIDKAIEYGLDGVITGFATNEELLRTMTSPVFASLFPKVKMEEETVNEKFF